MTTSNSKARGSEVITAPASMAACLIAARYFGRLRPITLDGVYALTKLPLRANRGLGWGNGLVRT